MLHTLIGALQWLALFTAPSFLKPYWSSYITLIGGEFYANVLGNFILSSLVLLLGNAFFYFLYRAQLPSIECYRISSKPWPWQSEKTASTFSTTVWNGAGLALFNLLLTLPLGWAGYPQVKQLGYSASMEDYPTTLTIFSQVLVFMVIEDTLFYWGHRTLHHPSLYPYIHKVHHRFTHSVSIAATATHPIEYMVSNVLPFVAGPTLLGAHCVTIYVWVVFRLGETIFNHSGYALPWSMYSLLPFQGTATDHDVHHSVNTGNFGSLFFFWDHLCGTHVEKVVEKGD